MSNQQSHQSHSHSSHSYSSYTSTSYSSSSSTNNGQTHSRSEETRASYNDRDGGSAHRVTRETGKPDVVEHREIPVGGGRLESGSGERGRIEDVTESEADRKYLEAMEDEYAKREGGA